jgi:hypothetical protein
MVGALAVKVVLEIEPLPFQITSVPKRHLVEKLPP